MLGLMLMLGHIKSTEAQQSIMFAALVSLDRLLQRKIQRFKKRKDEETKIFNQVGVHENQRLRRWPNNKPALGQHHVFSEKTASQQARDVEPMFVWCCTSVAEDGTMFVGMISADSGQVAHN